MPNITKTGLTRVFIIEGRADPVHEPLYDSCIRADALSRGYGDVTAIECPDPDNYDKFIEVDSTQGAKERLSIPLIGRYPADLASTLMRLAELGCALDAQVHIGRCTVPGDFNTFQKALIVENAVITNYSTDPLGALESGGRNPVNETAALSGGVQYEVLPLTVAEQAASLITNELVDVAICGSQSCGECEEQSDGCQNIYAVSLGGGGSPTTPADVVYSHDGGKAWHTSEVDSLGAAEDPTALACVGEYLVVVSDDSCSLHYVPLEELAPEFGDETWTEVTTGFVDLGLGTCPLDIWSVGQYAFIAAEGGYVYGLGADVTAGVEVLSAASATTAALRAVHALDRYNAVAVGSGGTVIYTTNGGETWALANSPFAPGGPDLHSVWMKSKTQWWVGAANGTLWYTKDAGDTWTEKEFHNSGSGIVYDIAFATESVGYIAYRRDHLAVLTGNLLRTYNGGYDWNPMPEKGGTLPGAQRFDALAACKYDANMMVAVGLDEGGTDGILVVAKD